MGTVQVLLHGVAPGHEDLQAAVLLLLDVRPEIDEVVGRVLGGQHGVHVGEVLVSPEHSAELRDEGLGRRVHRHLDRAVQGGLWRGWRGGEGGQSEVCAYGAR